MEFSITTTPLLGIFLGLGLSLITIVFILKYRFFARNKDAYSKYYWQRKASRANVFAFNFTFFLCGLILALSVAVLALNWTVHDLKSEPFWEDFEAPLSYSSSPPPPPLPPSADQGEVVYKVVNQMPRFPGCEGIEGTEQENKVCANKKLLDFIWKNLKWPPDARDASVHGICVISFIINEEGMIENPRIVRDIGAGCGEEALRVVKLMNEKGIRWIPGVHRGRNVKVQYNLPIKFK